MKFFTSLNLDQHPHMKSDLPNLALAFLFATRGFDKLSTKAIYQVFHIFGPMAT